jgi:hypothetical protein
MCGGWYVDGRVIGSHVRFYELQQLIAALWNIYMGYWPVVLPQHRLQTPVCYFDVSQIHYLTWCAS